MVDRRNRILPDQGLLRHERSEITCDRAHVAVRELEPRTREGVGELLRMLIEASRDLLVSWIKAQREIGDQHGRYMLLGFVVGVWNRGGGVLRLVLMSASRTLRQLPFILEEVLEVVVAPLGRRLRPGNFRAAGDGVGCEPRTV